MTKDGDDRPDEIEAVGYRRPPVEHQIKPGEVRNQWGRKGKPRPKLDFLDEPFGVCIDGEEVCTTRRLALDHALFNAALAKGRVSSVRELERRSRERREADDNVAGEVASPDEQAAFDRYLFRRLEELQASAKVDQEQKRGSTGNRTEGQGRARRDRDFDPGVKK